jgi:tetratricopeptide (TPR) repeat protein
MFLFLTDHSVYAQVSNDPAAAFKQGNVLLDQGRYEEAIENLDEVLEVDPNSVAALFNKAFALSNHL